MRLLLAAISVLVILLIACEGPPEEEFTDYTTHNDEAFVTGDDTLIIDGDISLEQIEEMIEHDCARRHVNSFEDYDSILTILDQDHFKVVPMYMLEETVPDSNEIVVALRHDIDYDPFTSVRMAALEKQHGFSATYYILHSAEYFGYYEGHKLVTYGANMALWDSLKAMGHEVGDHNDCITMEICSDLNMKNMILIWHKILSNRDIQVYGSAAHGAPECHIYDYANFEYFSEFARSDFIEVDDKSYQLGKYSISDLNYNYEGYHIDKQYYFSDVGGHWKAPGNPIDVLPTIPMGSKVIILVHPVWWG